MDTLKKEELKALIFSLIVTIIYIPLCIFLFNFIYTRLDLNNVNGETSLIKYIITVVVVSILTAFFVLLLSKVVNAYYKVRNIQRYRLYLLLSFVLYLCLLIIAVRFKMHLLPSENLIYISYYYFISSFFIYSTLSDYDTFKFGLYNEYLAKYVTYTTERKFTFKEDLRPISDEIDTANNPLLELNNIILKQTEELALKDDLQNIGKYYTYYIKSYFEDDIAYYTIMFSRTGKSETDIIADNNKLEIQEYEKTLEILNESITNYCSNPEYENDYGELLENEEY